MSNIASRPSARFDSVARFANSPSVQIWLFATTLFSSALLLFAVQPMFAKMALPKLGGSPSVWAVSMCFFQAALLAGYCYAHTLNRFLAPRSAVLAHVTLLLVTLLALPIGLPASLGEPPQGDAYIWLTSVLILGVGLPFLAVSANAPLLQAWFARTGHPAARDPYFLYGASNIGSLLALLSYPIVIEPMLGVQAQAHIWSLGFIALALLITLCGMLMIWLQNHNTVATEANSTSTATTTITALQRGAWVLLAALPSGLMVAVTTYVTTDVASAPFIWVMPLALFLATFILVFKDQVSPHYPKLAYALPIVVLADFLLPFGATKLIMPVAAFFIASLICHRELYLRRPAASHLTAFYLWMSFGGVIGGMFAALLAPQIFTSTYEFNALLAVSLFCAPGLLFQTTEPIHRKRVAIIAAIAATGLVLPQALFPLVGLQPVVTILLVVASLLVAAIILAPSNHERRLVGSITLATWLLFNLDPFLGFSFSERSFFGAVRVFDSRDGLHRYMLHGTTLHGQRRLKSDDGTVVDHPEPASYFHPKSGLARGFALARQATAQRRGTAIADTAMSVGIVGLGTGSLACYAKTGDSFRFYEIDPVVVKAATNPKLFDFMSKCTPNAPIVIGDARLTIQKEAQQYDYLIIDAFSSDSIPVHLMTVESIELYLKKLAPGGVLALHISNRYVDLPGAMSATIAAIPGLHGVLVHYKPDAVDTDAQKSNVMLVSRNAASLEPALNWKDASKPSSTSIRPWTDDYSNLIAAIWRQLIK